MGVKNINLDFLQDHQALLTKKAFAQLAHLKQKKQYEESMILSIILARVKIRVKIRKKYYELRYDCSFRCSHRFFAAHSDAWRRFGTLIFLKMLWR